MKVISHADHTETECISVHNVTEISKLISQFWRDDESLWAGKLPIKQIAMSSKLSLYSNVFRYFEIQKYKCSVDEICDNDIDVTDYWLEIFPKILWLSDVWFKHQEFADPLMVHWNPRKQINVVHPGITRLSVIDMFANTETDVSVIYFNTGGGYDHSVMGSLERLDWETLSINEWNIFTFVPDHGSLIPHFSKLVEPNSNFKKHYHLRIQNRLANMQLSVNNKPDDFCFLDQWITDKSSDVSITFKNECPSSIDCCRALICALLRVEYTSESLTIKICN